jgi:predicted RNA-binding Zn-ribbon protein involved in translation (DUF1610 family)
MFGISKKEKELIIQRLKQQETQEISVMKVAHYSFPCPVCGNVVNKGSNYRSIHGLNICLNCA